MMLSFENVAKSYGSIRALDSLSFAVGRGEIVAMLGPNGAGKTTALEIALGLRDADAGSARLFGGSPRNVAMRRLVGATPQASGFPDMLSVREILSFVAEHYARPARLDETVERFGLSELATRRVGTLSVGQSRRLALALAFVGNPELAVLDEPTVGLDVESRQRLRQVVRDLSDGRSVLFTTHDLEEAQAIATRVLVIDRGRLLFDGDAEALRSRVGGRRLRYRGKDGAVSVTTEDSDAYVRAMVAGGVAFENLEITRPSLEEAFLSLTGGQK